MLSFGSRAPPRMAIVLTAIGTAFSVKLLLATTGELCEPGQQAASCANQGNNRRVVGSGGDGMGPRSEYRLLLVSSSGGVLLDLLALEPWWSRHRVTWASVSAPDTDDVLGSFDVRWLPEQSAGRPWRLPMATLRAWRHLGAARPDVVVSPGTGVAVGYFLAARLRRIPTMWVETFNMVDQPGVAARVCARLAGAVVIQRPELLATRRNAVLVGELY